jgi:hypothetical protein
LSIETNFVSSRAKLHCRSGDYLGLPYINNCGFDAAGELLQHIYRGILTPPKKNTATNASAYIKFDQKPFVPLGYTLATAGLLDTGVVLVPASCQTKQCLLHVALHGCEQGAGHVGPEFYEHAGYKAWAEANDFVVLFPQAVSATIVNPKGCWDWFGYTGLDYSSKLGAQMKAIIGMVRHLQR